MPWKRVIKDKRLEKTVDGPSHVRFIVQRTQDIENSVYKSPIFPVFSVKVFDHKNSSDDLQPQEGQLLNVDMSSVPTIHVSQPLDAIEVGHEGIT